MGGGGWSLTAPRAAAAHRPLSPFPARSLIPAPPPPALPPPRTSAGPRAGERGAVRGGGRRGPAAAVTHPFLAADSGWGGPATRGWQRRSALGGDGGGGGVVRGQEGAWGRSRVGPAAHPQCTHRTRIAPAGPAAQALDLHCMHQTPTACAGPMSRSPDPHLVCQTHITHTWTHSRPASQAPDPYCMHCTHRACIGHASCSPDLQCTRCMHQTLPARTRPTSHAPDPPCTHQSHLACTRPTSSLHAPDPRLLVQHPKAPWGTAGAAVQLRFLLFNGLRLHLRRDTANT